METIHTLVREIPLAPKSMLFGMKTQISNVNSLVNDGFNIFGIKFT